jgi:hypothetical protein
MTDFGEGKHVVGRKRHRCEMCYAAIPQGERHYHFHGMYDGDFQDWRAHEECFEGWQADGDEELTPGDFPVPEAVAQRLAATPEGTEQK